MFLKKYKRVIEYKIAKENDFERLFEIRLIAMTESFSVFGSFNPDRLRESFRKDFIPKDTKWIIVDGIKIGFYILSECENGMNLTHFYILPQYQGTGIGSEVMNEIFEICDGLKKDLKLTAIQKSRSNNFYLRHGFTFIGSEKWSDCYIRKTNKRVITYTYNGTRAHDEGD